MVDVNIQGRTNVAGLLGDGSDTVIKKSYTTGTVTGAGDNVGGLAGRGSNLVIENSYTTGVVTGVAKVGGLVGSATTGSVTNSYATGEVTGTTSVGGLVGENSASVTNSFYNTQTTGQTSSAGGEGKTTQEMQDIATFTSTTPSWSIEEDSTINKGIPFLAWQKSGNSYISIWVIGTKEETTPSEVKKEITEARKVTTAIFNDEATSFTPPRVGVMALPRQALNIEIVGEGVKLPDGVDEFNLEDE